VHAEQSTPPYGRSGLLLDLGIFFIFKESSLGTPAKGFRQLAQTALLGFFLR
jgi:hypothetical protein